MGTPRKPSLPPEEGVWWCNSHERQATHIDKRGEHCCDPKLGGIMLPCKAVFVPITFLYSHGHAT